MEIRPYQRDALNAIPEYFSKFCGNPLVEIPPGGGKAFVISTFCRETLEEWADTRILMVTHVAELIAQNYADLLRLWPDAPVGVYSAGLRKRQISQQIIFAGVQSIWNKAYKLQKIDLMLVDEAHLIPRDATTTYRKLIRELLIINPNMKVIGFTATPYRLDSGMLHQGPDAIFSAICYSISIRTLIDLGFLCPPIAKPGRVTIDTTGLRVGSNGDYVQVQLEARANDPETVRAICEETAEHAADRTAILTFCCGIKHAEAMRDGLRDVGVTAEVLHGKLEKGVRRATLANFKARKFKALVLVGIGTTGLNVPFVDMIVLARATKSTNLYVQIIGRGTRLSYETGKVNCLVLDYGRNIATHGPIDNLTVKPKRAKDKAETADMPVKVCPICETKNAIAARECVGCGHEFPEFAPTLSHEASTLAILSGSRPEWLDVDHVTYAKHNKADAPPTMRVTYLCGLLSYSEWVCFEHTGMPRQKACKWWMERASDTAVPTTVEAAVSLAKLHGRLRPARQIAVRPTGKFHDIVGVTF